MSREFQSISRLKVFNKLLPEIDGRNYPIIIYCPHCQIEKLTRLKFKKHIFVSELHEKFDKWPYAINYGVMLVQKNLDT